MSNYEQNKRLTSKAKTYGEDDHGTKKSFRRKKRLTVRSQEPKRLSDTPKLLPENLEFPMTPEMLLEHHKQRPILDSNEEWIVVVLNEYECLIDSLEVIKSIAFHSKFYEVSPEELWEEFFEFMEEVPSYDEVINNDVWQEFRDKRYSC